MANATLDLDARLDTYAVAPRADHDYRETVFTCPTNGRRYLSVTEPLDFGISVATSCYWCDTSARRRGQDTGFDAAAPQCHMYPLEVRP